jgi:hypothetical protein
MKIYIFGYVIPFGVQLMLSQSPLVSYLCLTSCLLSQLYLFKGETIQMQEEGFAVYISEKSNKIDMLMFILNIFYIMGRFLRLEACYIPNDIGFINVYGGTGGSGASTMATQVVFMVLLTILILTFTAFKVMFYLKIYEKFG